MIAAFSLPLFAAWALLDDAMPARIRSFRVVLTLGAALLMGAMVFVRQRLLDRELLRLLDSLARVVHQPEAICRPRSRNQKSWLRSANCSAAPPMN